jgi:GNAT superfamily N-acetyltransferase
MSSSKKCLEIRRLRAADARSYRAVLIEALILHPDCFPEDYSTEISRPLSDTEEELEQSGTFGAWFDEVLAGIGSGVACSASKRRHCGMVRDLYVKERYRHKGVASLLLQEILRYATNNVEQLEVEVPARCENVVRLFERFGFRLCGLLPSGLRVGQEELDVWTMTRALDDSGRRGVGGLPYQRNLPRNPEDSLDRLRRMIAAHTVDASPRRG